MAGAQAFQFIPEAVSMAYKNLLVGGENGVGIITLNRPEALNTLNSALMAELREAIDRLEADDAIGAIIITGNEKAFAAGADIKEMKDMSAVDMYMSNYFTAGWERVTTCRKPVIAAVSGYALGGGCELAMMCDFIVAADNAKFGQPEINLAIPPGIGGTQRLTRLVGKSKAMDMCLTGRMMSAEEAERAGLVSRVFPAADLLVEAQKIAKSIAEQSRPAVYMAKEAVNKALETTLAEGVSFERRLFHAAFATDNQKEGMAAFAEKRKPQFKNR
jgi:enoyl-CoA hydratase